MKGRISVALAAAIVLMAAPAALAGVSLHVGVVEDAAVWGNAGGTMDMAKTAGFDSVRMTAQWTTGVTSLTSGHASRLRSAAQAATARGLQPIISIYNAGSSSTPADPVGRAQFVSFATSVVRALPTVTTFIVGNEPNSNLYWQPQFNADGSDAAAPAYEQLLASAYDAIKAVRPTATVIGGALDPRGTDDATGDKPSHSPTTFITDFGAAYRLSGRATPLMDVFDQHVYADNSSLPPSMAHPVSATIGEADYPRLVALLGKAFDGTAQAGSTLPIVYGEFGVESTIPPEKAGAYSGTELDASKPVDETTQAAYYTEAFKLALCQPNVIGIMVFHVIDESALSGWQSGPYYADGTPKSSLPAIRDAATAARAGTLTGCPDRQAPAVTIAAPAADGTVTGTAKDDVGVGRVDLVVNGAVAGTRYAAPFAFPWTPPRAGRYTLGLRAVDAAGNVGTATLTVTAVHASRGDASGAGGTVWSFGPPPVNDLFAAAQPLHGHASGTTAFATAERGEPKWDGTRSVWFAWRAPTSGNVRFAASGGSLTVYTGSNVGVLRRVAGGRSALVSVQRGTTYRIAVGGSGTAFRLAWSRAH